MAHSHSGQSLSIAIASDHLSVEGRNKVTESKKRVLKILHIDPEREWGGGETEVIDLLAYLSSWEHQNHLLCHPGGPLMDRVKKNKAVTIFPIAVRNDLDIRAIPFLRRLIHKEAYDIVHFHTKRAHALSLYLERTRPEMRFVVTRRMDYPVTQKWYNRYLYSRCVDGIIALSHKIADVLVEAGIDREKIRVIYTGIDPEPFQKAATVKPNNRVSVIGTAAVLEERKGYQYLLEAAALLKRQGYQLQYRFAGEGSQREALQNLATDLGLKEEVVFEGFVSDIPGFLASIDVFVLPSLHEGMGVAILEAMAAAKPVVGTTVGGIPELVVDGVTGLLVPPRNASALADAISRLLSDKDLPTRMGVSGCQRVQTDFTMEQTAKQVEHYYYELQRVGRDDQRSQRSLGNSSKSISRQLI